MRTQLNHGRNGNFYPGARSLYTLLYLLSLDLFIRSNSPRHFQCFLPANQVARKQEFAAV